MQLIDLAIGLVATSMFTRVQEAFEYVINVALTPIGREEGDMHSQPTL
jgi:hypothetical protein